MYCYLGFYKLDYGPKFRYYLISHMNKGYFACKRRNVLMRQRVVGREKGTNASLL